MRLREWSNEVFEEPVWYLPAIMYSISEEAFQEKDKYDHESIEYSFLVALSNGLDWFYTIMNKALCEMEASEKFKWLEMKNRKRLKLGPEDEDSDKWFEASTMALKEMIPRNDEIQDISSHFKAWYKTLLDSYTFIQNIKSEEE